ncbi:MAG: hypothetical protein WC443_06370 [Desulfobaccales bacterium]
MIHVKYIGGNHAGVSQKWGGTCATNYALLKALEGHPEFVFEAKFRKDFPGLLEIRRFLEGADVTHVDDTFIVSRMFHGGFSAPDIIGPITRSPLKNYEGWTAPYTAEWFYQAQVIRLNYAEERHDTHLVRLIRHGVDTGRLQPCEGAARKYVLWAGDKNRPAKNYPLMEEIMQGFELPDGYEFRVLTDYPVQDYWTLLDETAVLVNTSRHESFCCAAFEAMAKGVPVIWRQGLQGGVHEAAGLRVSYEAGAYRAAILETLSGENYLNLGQAAREYCETNASLAVMGEDLAAVYGEVMEKKKAEAT